MPKSGEELFTSGELLNNSQADAILRSEACRYAARSIQPAKEGERRRRFLGPSADITHPDFGLRPNQPEETFGIYYSITDRLPTSTETHGKMLKGTVTVVEKVCDADGRIIERNISES